MLSFKDKDDEWHHYTNLSLITLLTRNWIEMGLRDRFIMWDDNDSSAHIVMNSRTIDMLEYWV